MGKYQAYSQYKSTNIVELASVPSHWQVAALRRYIEEHRQGYYTTASYVDDGVKLLRITDLRPNGGVDIADCPKVPNSDESLVNYDLKAGDVVFARTGGAGSFGVIPNLSERVVYASYLIRFRFYKEKLHSNFLKFVLQGDPFQKSVRKNIHGGVNQNIHAEDIKDTFIAKPDIEEQTQIANFLDHETAKIDTLIDKQKQLIKLLIEKRQAVISHAVTKGLNPDAPMKDSEVEWLGEIPEHWSVTSIKHQCALIDGDRGSHYPNENDYVDVGIPFFSSKNIIHYKLTKKNLKFISESKFMSLGRGKLAHNDLIITVRGTIGHVAIFDASEIGCNTGFINAQMMIIRPTKQLTDFLLYLSESDVWSHQLNLYSYGSTVKQLSNEVVGNFKFVLPHQDDMAQLLTHLKDVDSRYVKLIHVAEQQIKLMTERRIALISAAVTGKIDVRNWQAPINREAQQQEVSQ